MRSLYFYTASLTFLLGVGLGSFVSFSIWFSVWLLLLSLGLISYWRHQVNKLASASFIFVLALASISLALGIFRFDLASQHFESLALIKVENQTVALEGLIVKEPEERARTQHLTLKTELGRILIITDRYQNINYGDEIIVQGKLSSPQSFTTDLGRTFDYKNYLRAKGISAVMIFPELSVQSKNNGNFILRFLYTNKEKFVTAINQSIAEPASGLGLGVLLGVKQALGEDLEQAFRQTGIIHIVVLSGYNVMLVVAAVMYLLVYVLPLRSRVIVGIVAIILFAFLVGLGATVVRASVMAILVLLAQALGRTYNILRALTIAAGGMVFYQPYILAFDIGFQLSFMATLGLVLVAPYFETMFIKTGVRVGVRQFLVATIATQLAVWPLLLFHIGQASLIAVVVNLLVLPLVPVAMLATAIVGVAALLWPSLASVLAIFAYGILMVIIKIAVWFSVIPLASITVPTFSWPWVVVMYLGLGAGLWWAKKFFKQPALAKASINPDTENLTADWTVVEESELFPAGLGVDKKDTGRGRSPRPVSKEDKTPIFFR